MTMQIIKSNGEVPICWENPQVGISSSIKSIDGTLIPWSMTLDQWNSVYLYSIHEQDTVRSLTNMFESTCVGAVARVDIVSNPGTRRRSAFIHFMYWGRNWFTEQLRRELEHARDTRSMSVKITDPKSNNWIYSISINHKPISCEPLNLVQLTANDQEMSARLMAQQSKIDELVALVADLRQKYESLVQAPSIGGMSTPLINPNHDGPLTISDLDTRTCSGDWAYYTYYNNNAHGEHTADEIDQLPTPRHIRFDAETDE